MPVTDGTVHSELYRIPDAIQSDGHTILAGNEGKSLDLSYGGQFGWSPRLGRIVDVKHYSEWISNQAYISRNVISITLQYPKAFDFMGESSEKWRKIYKALMETQAESITGFQAGLTVETEGHAVGGGGEEQLEVTDVKRARTEVTYKWRDRLGNSISNFLETYIRYCIMDPETKTALLGTLDTYPVGADGKPDVYTADYQTGTVLYIEPDITHKQVIKAWLVTNLFPQGTGDIIAKFDKNQPGEMSELEINMGGISRYGKAVNEFATVLLTKLNSVEVDPTKATLLVDPENPVDAKLADSDNTVGIFRNSKVDDSL